MWQYSTRSMKLTPYSWNKCCMFHIAPHLYTVDMVIFACLNIREFLILGLFTKPRIRDFLFIFCSAIRIIIFAWFLNSRICPPREFAKIKTSRILPDLQYIEWLNNDICDISCHMFICTWLYPVYILCLHDILYLYILCCYVVTSAARTLSTTLEPEKTTPGNHNVI